MEAQKYWPPYIVGFMLGLVLLASYFLTGRGLGASGAVKRTVTYVEMKIAPDYVKNNHFLSKYARGEHSPLRNWLVFEVLGVMIGGLISGALAGRMKWKVEHGPRFSDKKRLLFAFIGGSLMGFGAALSRGCTSGQALSGGSTLAVGSWAFMIMIFVGGYMLAYFLRKQWI